jgi:hypothetical protein
MGIKRRDLSLRYSFRERCRGSLGGFTLQHVTRAKLSFFSVALHCIAWVDGALVAFYIACLIFELEPA